MRAALKVDKLVSGALFGAMTGYAKDKVWDIDIYGVGPFPRPIEVAITRRAVDVLGGITEVRQNGGWPNSMNRALLSHAFDDIREGLGVDARIDGFIDKLNCFLETKVSKIDQTHGSRGGRCLYDIGQWAHDIGRLAIIGKHFPRVGLIYSIVAIRRNTYSEFTDTSWLEAFRAKLNAELNNDLNRTDSELRQDTPHRRLQWKILKKLSNLEDAAFLIEACEKWATITIETRPFVVLALNNA